MSQYTNIIYSHSMQVKYDSINVGENQLAKITRRKLLCFPFGQTDRNLDINMFYFIKRLATHSLSPFPSPFFPFRFALRKLITRGQLALTWTYASGHCPA